MLSRCLGLVLPRYSYCASGIFVSKVEPAQFETHWLGFSISIVILARGQGRVAWIDSVIAQESVPEILLGALLLVDDIARLALLCPCSFVCGYGPLCALLVWWNQLVDHGP